MSGGNDGGLYSETFSAIVRSANVASAIQVIRDNYGFAHTAYHFARAVGRTVEAPFVRTTYPHEWIGYYLANQFFEFDPIVREAYLRHAPFDWADLEPTQALKIVRTAAKSFNIGVSGYSVPLIDKKGRRAVFWITSNLEGQAWRDFISPLRKDMNKLAYDIHMKAITECYGDEDPIPVLTPRERECLNWISQGKTYSAIAVILDLSEHTVRTYLKTARVKLDSITLAQAVAKARRLHII